MIRVLALDIDGVLTDGKVMLDESGRESKSLSYQDIDAVFLAQRQGVQVVLVTGEASPWVDMIADRLEISRVYRGAKDKGQAVRDVGAELGVSLAHVCYVGDSLRDADALAVVGLGLAPANATNAAQAAADRILTHRGGEGAVAEAVEIVLQAVETACP
jgi:3-deoxy-D-manno-octulosonate 8-phosphate phosphatase (KDO 8-P phosphatase)